MLPFNKASSLPSQELPHDGIMPPDLQATCTEAALLRRNWTPGSRCVTRRLLPKLGWHLPSLYRLLGALIKGDISTTLDRSHSSADYGGCWLLHGQARLDLCI